MDSEVLDNIHKQFVEVVVKQGIRIYSLQEGRGISGMRGLYRKVRYRFLEHATSNFTNLYGHIQVVSDFSSKLGLLIIKTTESIDTNYIYCTARQVRVRRASRRTWLKSVARTTQ